MNNITKQMSISETVAERLSNKRQLIVFLKEHGIADVCAINSIDHGQRQGLIASVEEEQGMKAIRIIIDIRAGQPTTEQVFDMVYGKGKDCQKRIIIFTEDANNNDIDNPTAGVVTARVAGLMNLYQLDIHLFEANKKGKLAKIDTAGFLSEDEAEEKYSIADLPSEQRFRLQEFWSIFFDTNDQAYFDSYSVFESQFLDVDDCTFTFF